MSDICATKIIKNKDGSPLVINESDFDAEKHELFTDPLPEPKKAATAPAPAAAIPATVAGGEATGGARKLGVIHDGNRKKNHQFVVVYEGTADLVTDVEGIDIGGYKDASAAWAAIMALQTAPAT